MRPFSAPVVYAAPGDSHSTVPANASVKEKYNAIINKIIECNKRGQPVLVGTTSIEKSEKISSYLSQKKVNHNVLNAKQHEKEANIIAEAGKINAVTIATNMAGRGTDIKLGGNKDFVYDGKKEDVKEND